MPTHHELAATAPWVQVSADAKDWASADADVPTTSFCVERGIRRAPASS